METQDKGKMAGIVSYFGFIGWLIAYFALYKENKTALSTYQLRQTLLIQIVGIVVSIIIGLLLRILPSLAGVLGFVAGIFYLGLIVVWLIGLIGAINGQMKPMPLIGEKAQSTFPNL